MNKKQEIIKLLKKEQNQKLAKFFLQNLDSISKNDLNDLYYLLIETDKTTIDKFSQKKLKSLEENFAELDRIGIQTKKITVQFKEQQIKSQDNYFAENLLKNL